MPSKPEMITLKSSAEIELMREANQIVVEVLDEVEKAMAPGVSTAELDRIAEAACRKRKGIPAFKGLYGFPKSLVVELNEVVVHGIPSEKVVLKEGDICGIDFGVCWKGYYGDHARTIRIGKVEPRIDQLVTVTRECLYLGIEQMVPGKYLGDIGHAIQTHAEAAGFSVVRDFVGHGIGRKPHEPPQVANYGRPGMGVKLKEGMVLALEPMICLGGHEIEVLKDGWTAVTKDRRWSAHFEHSVAITKNGPDILSSRKE
ncbi:MAG: Methionine aminopeptidase 1 [Myxococcota bacterium]|nr:Methionine aminopeptidase 1 [Myxococcota bacterium]